MEFDHTKVVNYDPAAARALSKVLDELPGMVFEAHSTDYQKPKALVNNGFAILKVELGVTFALREALFALADIENELIPEGTRSKLRAVAEHAMLDKPGNWDQYYHGDEDKLRLMRVYSYSDRIRYYWADPRVDEAAHRLVDNLARVEMRENLLSRYLPEQYRQVRRGKIDATPMSFIYSKVRNVIGLYVSACLKS